MFLDMCLKAMQAWQAAFSSTSMMTTQKAQRCQSKQNDIPIQITGFVYHIMSSWVTCWSYWEFLKYFGARQPLIQSCKTDWLIYHSVRGSNLIRFQISRACGIIFFSPCTRMPINKPVLIMCIRPIGQGISDKYSNSTILQACRVWTEHRANKGNKKGALNFWATLMYMNNLKKDSNLSKDPGSATQLSPIRDLAVAGKIAVIIHVSLPICHQY